TTLCFAINFSAMIWVLARHQISYEGRAILFNGECSKASHINSGIHLVINVLSSLLLGASNYSMQCLSAPTRLDVDKAHVKGRWLDIGVPSVRNISAIGWARVLLWFSLAISSLPLHLL
ncbi:hypothetical protein M501DRAFT_922725, partial [Patellaria atrata CBS 101060]